MKALILAGGKATRLLPITTDMPKCLLPIADKTILGWQIEALRKNGVSDVILLTGMHAEQVEAYMRDVHPDVHATYIHNERFAETRPAYALYLAREHLREGNILYLNGDALFERAVLSAVLDDRHSSTTAIRHDTWDEEQVNVILEDNRVIEIGKHIKEQSNHGEFVGVTKFDASFGGTLAAVLEEVPQEKRDAMFAVDAMQAAIMRGANLYAVDVTDKKAIEVDTAEDYERAQKLWKGT